MRIAAVLLSALLLLGSMALYLNLAKRARPAPRQPSTTTSMQQVQIELTATFDASASGWNEPVDAVLEVRSSGRTLVLETRPIRAFEPQLYNVSLPSLPQIELWCAAHAGSDALLSNSSIETDRRDSEPVRGLRVRLGRQGQWWSDTTIWSIPGGAPAGRVLVTQPTLASASETESSTVPSSEVETVE